jgi:hypothetical protein
MTVWKAQLENLDSLFEELRWNRDLGCELRFGRSVIVASDIAEQFYCEKKLKCSTCMMKWKLKLKTWASKLMRSLLRTR